MKKKNKKKKQKKQTKSKCADITRHWQTDDYSIFARLLGRFRMLPSNDVAFDGVLEQWRQAEMARFQVLDNNQITNWTDCRCKRWSWTGT